MKRARNEFNKSEEELSVKKIKSQSGLLSLPNDILITLFSLLSCCEYNIFRLVSHEFKNSVSAIIGRGKEEEEKNIITNCKITTNSSFIIALTQFLLKSLKHGYLSLFNWYQDERKQNIEMQLKENSPGFFFSLYKAALQKPKKETVY